MLTKKFDFYPVRHFFANFLQSFTLDFSIVPVYLVVKSWSCYQFDNVVPILINHPAFFPIFIHLFTFFPVLLEAYFFSFFSKNLKLPEMEFFLLLLKILPDPNRQSQISFRWIISIKDALHNQSRISLVSFTFVHWEGDDFPVRKKLK